MNGFPPCSWGQPLWYFLHLISFAYPDNPDEQTKKGVYNFFKNLGTVLPCNECRDHYQKNFSNMSLENNINSREQLSRWVYNLHNMVSQQIDQTGKNPPPTYSEVAEKFNSLRTESCIKQPGVCSGNSPNEMMCKVELVPKNSYENFTNLSVPDSVYITIIVILLIIIAILAYLHFSGKQVKRIYR